MFKFLKNWKATPETPIYNGDKTPAESAAIAAPKANDNFSYNPQEPFIPIDVVAPSQIIPGKFNYHSATWKYLQNHLTARLTTLSRQNENGKLSIERTQLLRGQIKEIKLLLKHTNQLAGITVSPTTTLPDEISANRGYPNE